MEDKCPLTDLFLFHGLSVAESYVLLSRISHKEVTVKAGEYISAGDHYERALGFVLKGELAVVRHSGEKAVPLNRLKRGDSFGAAALFNESIYEYPTEIIAQTDADLLFIPEDGLESLFKNSYRVSNNYIHFLTGRIRFLNEKIYLFSAKNTEAKTASFLLYHEENGVVKIKNYSASAEVLSIGRASLYRVLDAFSRQKLILRKNTLIEILDKNELERIANS